MQAQCFCLHKAVFRLLVSQLMAVFVCNVISICILCRGGTLQITQYLAPIRNVHVKTASLRSFSWRPSLMGSQPFMGCMIRVILLLCFFPGLATWLPDYVMEIAV